MVFVSEAKADQRGVYTDEGWRDIIDRDRDSAAAAADLWSRAVFTPKKDWTPYRSTRRNFSGCVVDKIRTGLYGAYVIGRSEMKQFVFDSIDVEGDLYDVQRAISERARYMAERAAGFAAQLD